MTDTDRTAMLLEAVDLLAPTFDASRLDEIEVEVGDVLVRLARPRPTPAAPTSVPAVEPALAEPRPASRSEAPAVTPFGEPSPGMRFVSAPLTGVWYAAPSPGARPYVSEGVEIAAGQVVGMIEAMKLFNEIKSDVGGRVARVLVEDGTLAKRQQPLIEIDPR